MLKKRIFMSLIGVIICAISVGVFKIAVFGVDPFQSFMSGLTCIVPIDFGTLYVIVNGILLLFSLVFNRKNIGIATFINLFLLGYITQFAYEVLQNLIINPSIVIRILCLALGIAIICFGSSLYMTADLGVSTYDSVAITISEKWKLGKFKYVRIISDLIMVATGIVLFILGNGAVKEVTKIVGIGTVVTAFFMGPLISWFNNKVAIPMLCGNSSD